VLFMENEPPLIELTPEEMRELVRAKRLLENPGHAARLGNLLGSPLERGFELLPAEWSGGVHKAVNAALFKALEMAVLTMDTSQGARREKSILWHRVAVGASGMFGGALGLAGLPLELPLSTTLILRSIATIAREEGHDLGEISTRLHCLEVFAFGGRSREDDASDSSYWAVRAALGTAVSEAVSYISRRGLLDRSAPVIVRLMASIASRFGVIVSQQMAAKAVPIIGAAGGSVVNVLFMAHFQDMARGHFIIKRLEKKYGAEFIEALYHSIAIPVRES
jgi:hypothetical protein